MPKPRGDAAHASPASGTTTDSVRTRRRSATSHRRARRARATSAAPPPPTPPPSTSPPSTTPPCAFAQRGTAAGSSGTARAPASSAARPARTASAPAAAAPRTTTTARARRRHDRARRRRARPSAPHQESAAPITSAVRADLEARHAAEPVREKHPRLREPLVVRPRRARERVRIMIDARDLRRWPRYPRPRAGARTCRSGRASARRADANATNSIATAIFRS